MSIELVMPSHHLILCCSFLLLPSIFPSIQVFSNELALCIRWSIYCSFNIRISPSNECSGLISFKIDWFYLLAVLGTLNSLLQHHNSKATIQNISSLVLSLLYGESCHVCRLSHVWFCDLMDCSLPGSSVHRILQAYWSGLPFPPPGKSWDKTKYRHHLGYFLSFFFFFKLNLFAFNWRIISLQYHVGFCQISAWISHRYTCVPSFLGILPTSLPIPSRLFSSHTGPLSVVSGHGVLLSEPIV